MPASKAARIRRTARSGPSPRWNPALNDAPVRISARWHNVEISARELAALKPGALLRLRPDATRRVEVSLDNQPKFTGQLGPPAATRGQNCRHTPNLKSALMPACPAREALWSAQPGSAFIPPHQSHSSHPSHRHGRLRQMFSIDGWGRLCRDT